MTTQLNVLVYFFKVYTMMFNFENLKLKYYTQSQYQIGANNDKNKREKNGY